uniref:Retinoic acid receptor alpha n=1 Tax=Petromyzon marinus TaxID=7757 RepID=S4RJJ9_PETMA
QDKSSGYHYGVSSCEGCKGFFRRSIQNIMVYTCHRDKKCIINKITRNRCQYCRLQRCLEVGMSKESVRNDRSKKKKEVVRPELQEIPPPCPEIEDLIDRVRRAHQETFPSLCQLGKYTTSNGSGQRVTLDANLWDKFSELSTKCIVKTVEFAKRIPGFSTLGIDDQITLLKAACLDILVAHVHPHWKQTFRCFFFISPLSFVRRNGSNVTGGNFIGRLTFAFTALLTVKRSHDTQPPQMHSATGVSVNRTLEARPTLYKRGQPCISEANRGNEIYRQSRASFAHMFAKYQVPRWLKRKTPLGEYDKCSDRVITLKMEIPGSMPPLIQEMLENPDGPDGGGCTTPPPQSAPAAGSKAPVPEPSAGETGGAGASGVGDIKCTRAKGGSEGCGASSSTAAAAVTAAAAAAARDLAPPSRKGPLARC